VWSGFTYFRRGDLIIAKITPCFENGKAAYLDRFPTEFGFGSTEFIVVRPQLIVTGRYLYRALTLAEFRKLGADSMLGAAGQQRVPSGFVSNFLITIPPLAEQSAITTFIDHLDRRIGRYIRAKKKLIALLNEQKQAIIHRAVTRGLDPNVRLKPSGVQWLDHMPAHWHRRSLGTCLQKIEQGWSPVAAGGDLVPGQWAVLTLSAVKRGIFNLSVKPIQMLEGNPSSIEIKDGDLLLTRSNTRGLVGDVCIIDGARPKTFFSDLIYRISVNSTVLEKRFLMYQLLSSFGRYQIERDARGSSGTMPKIGQQHIKAWQVLIPPSVEQQQIVSTIDSSTRRISIAISALGNHVALLGEYRARLIADVVTGKLDVREAAARLPDEVEDAQTAEPIEDADALTDRKAAEEDSEAAPEEALEEALA
jgi:type I restriction enzyme S subunit